MQQKNSTNLQGDDNILKIKFLGIMIYFNALYSFLSEHVYCKCDMDFDADQRPNTEPPPENSKSLLTDHNQGTFCEAL